MNRIIELKWNCSDCSSKGILGRHKNCPNCGAPREKGEMQMEGLGSSDYGSNGMNKAETVTDPKLLELANAGYDWFCTHCTSGNRGDGDSCKACGAPRYGDVEESHPDLNAVRAELPKGTEYAKRQVERHLRDTPPPPPPLGSLYSASSIKTQRAILIGGGVLALLAVIGVLWWALSIKDVPGQVIAMNWTHTTHMDRWTQITTGAWEDDTIQRQEIKPVNGRGERAGMIMVAGSCHEKHHHYQQYQCGTKQESYDCSYSESYSGTCTGSEQYACGETCTNSGNGFASCRTRYCRRSTTYSCTKTRRVPKTCERTVPKYCQRSIEETWCNYQTQKWNANVRTAVATGYGKDGMHFKELSPGALDRIRHSSKYVVSIGYEWDDKKEMYEDTMPKQEYLSWDDNEPVTVRVRNIGTVAGVVRHTKLEK